MSDPNDVQKVAKLVKEFRFAMLTTTGPGDKLVARPMTVQEAEFDGDLWFIAARNSHTVTELTSDPIVGVSFASNDTWVSLSGTAEVVEDSQKIGQLWNQWVEAWFPEGPDDPNTVLIKFTADSAEYWDSPGGRIASVISLVKAKVTGQPFDGGDNSKVEL
ncbi:pyridoxamine 5'-phosphate oxidase family protein [Cryobacterium sp. PH31-O1]|uniref:pyridoxamine 5'-phosphate oxidase family protein n=1 Tax=Cryobacterium sp. PH31-O1 TaxID=3046306 RepID=UPI0024B8DB12|nr:pyridoxamine 5'-phosphate oxidase family protein [Cryobacterium sp. PH31-O1]MDJ0338715.1 pyridoxamine 5'-phosphate oxidase family protein [Cryobacterium sp. PH31-O1]